VRRPLRWIAKVLRKMGTALFTKGRKVFTIAADNASVHAETNYRTPVLTKHYPALAVADREVQ